MIGIIFEQADKTILEIRLDGNSLMVRHQSYGNTLYPIKQAFNYQRCIAEYPEVEGKSSWREDVDYILKKKIKSMRTTKKKVQYIIDEMVKQGNTALYWQREGHRPQQIDGNTI